MTAKYRFRSPSNIIKIVLFINGTRLFSAMNKNSAFPSVIVASASNKRYDAKRVQKA